jgi:UDP-N-acetylglucosamine--N-acetylmuramyl-(pentapeptide) pyrophosphoryl-undecaprenol N-acetylglucosamine transferase
MSKKIFIVSGGTGGHIIPARCLAELLTKENHQIFFFGDNKIKNYQTSQDQFLSTIIQSSQLKKSVISLAKASIKIALGILHSSYFLISKRPNYVIAFGGYASFPMLLASVIFKCPIILHEQNAHLGKVNRIFAKYALKIATSFPKTTGITNSDLSKVIFTGNPVRSEIIALNEVNYQIPIIKEEIANETNLKISYDAILNSDFCDIVKTKEQINILVIGGSGGAKIFSEILPKAFFNFSENIKEKLQITQQCRAELVDSTLKSYQDLNMNATVSGFFSNMSQLLKDAHLVICRSGSSTIAECCIAKKPMILVPFALSADNHQQKNADYFYENGCAIVIKEQDFTINNLNNTINQLLTSPQTLKKMSQNCEKLAIINATKNLSKLVE